MCETGEACDVTDQFLLAIEETTPPGSEAPARSDDSNLRHMSVMPVVVDIF